MIVLWIPAYAGMTGDYLRESASTTRMRYMLQIRVHKIARLWEGSRLTLFIHRAISFTSDPLSIHP
jgi:hypothetical protein